MTGLRQLQVRIGSQSFMPGSTFASKRNCRYVQVKFILNPPNLLVLKSVISAIGERDQIINLNHMLFPVVNFFCDTHNENWHNEMPEVRELAVKELFSMLHVLR